MSNLPIQTKRLCIRRFTPADGTDFSEILTDPEVCFYEPFETFTHQAALIEAEKLAEDGSFYAVELMSERKLIGKLYLKDLEFFGAHELGYTFHRKYWGKGYAAEAASALAAYAFDTLGVRRITAEVDVRNQRSIRLLQRLGMRREGTFLKSAAFKTDAQGEPVWSDYHTYALLREEYRK
ncbi:MAG: GNAT family N-acetyltransferase [Oscillospiraceae bacterium]|nr:GNAT family N-acetyltransferase [Oscillospiraceae bacterium]